MFNMIKKCIICDKEFETKHPNHILCSSECRKINCIQQKAKWYRQNKEYNLELYRKQCREHYRNNVKPIKCKICGEVVERYIENGRQHCKHYHEDCIVRKAYEAIKRGESYSHYNEDTQRAMNRGYIKTEIIELIESGETSD